MRRIVGTAASAAGAAILVAASLAGCASAPRPEGLAAATPEDCAVIAAAFAADRLAHGPIHDVTLSIEHWDPEWIAQAKPSELRLFVLGAASLRLDACRSRDASFPAIVSGRYVLRGSHPCDRERDHAPGWVTAPVFDANRTHASFALYQTACTGLVVVADAERGPDGRWRSKGFATWAGSLRVD